MVGGVEDGVFEGESEGMVDGVVNRVIDGLKGCWEVYSMPCY